MSRNSRTCVQCGCSWIRKRADSLSICPGCEVEYAWCSICQEPLPRNGFSLNPTTRNGLHKYCKPCHAGRRLRHRYGIEVEDYDALFEAQTGTCAICHLPPAEGRPLVVDHCHTSLEVRGLLCSQCNAAIGLLMDSPDVIDSAAAYLRHHVAA